jgi:prophage regulatory protein
MLKTKADDLKELARERQRLASAAGAARDPYHHGASAAGGAGPRLMKRPEVEGLTGLSRSAIYDLMTRGVFPRTVKLGPKSVAWVDEEIRQWIADRIAARDAKAA